MFETGRGVPRNYTEAAMWYRRAAEQGDSLAQYSLGLLYDKGQGVPQDIVEANKWLNLSTAAAPRGAREARARLRDAVTSKMTRGEIARARLRALEWVPTRERCRRTGGWATALSRRAHRSRRAHDGRGVSLCPPCSFFAKRIDLKQRRISCCRWR
jgi:TPR repeat protein